MKQSWGSLIAQAAILGLKQKIVGIPLQTMFCLKFVRLCVEYALGLTPGGFYRLVVGVDVNPSAKELETLLRKQMPAWVVHGIENIKAGDTAWWNNLPPEWGHVGIIVWYKGAWYVAQNTVVTTGGVDYPGALRLLPFASMPIPTSIIRIGG